MKITELMQLSSDTTAFPWDKRTPNDGLRAVIAIAVALAVGQLSGHPSAGAIAAGTAYTVGFAVFHEALASTLLSMGILTVVLATATLAGSLGAAWTPVVMLLVLIAAVNYGLLDRLGATAGWMGMQAATYVIITSYFPHGLQYAVGRTAMVVAGGALQMAVFTALHLLNPRTRRTLRTPLFQRVLASIADHWRRLPQQLSRLYDPTSYTVRLAVTLTLATAIYRHYHVRNGYWSPMTALYVLKPAWANTVSRGIARFVGTLAGAGLAVLLAWYAPPTVPVVLVLVVLCAWGSYATQAVNYATFSFFVTLYVVFLFRAGGFSQTAAAHIRLFNTALGGVIALAVDLLWRLLAPRSLQPQARAVAATEPRL